MTTCHETELDEIHVCQTFGLGLEVVHECEDTRRTAAATRRAAPAPSGAAVAD